MTVALEIALQVHTASETVPSRHEVETWISEVVCDIRDSTEMTVRVVDEAESESLNHQYRQRKRPTNVLSFPADVPREVDSPLLGDIVICAPLVQAEAAARELPLTAHWAHLVVHGTLHLLGYDHETENQAREMEARETAILTKLGFPDPYLA